MRVGVDYRILSMGRSGVTRGMPRFTQQQLREVLRLDRDSTYVLLVDPRSDLDLILPEVRTAPNVEVTAVPGELTVDVDDPATLAAKGDRYQAWLAALRIDLYHATTPFFLEQLVPPAVDVCPVVATLYDLIPMLFPAHFLLNGRIEGSYRRAADLVRRADRVLAISAAARADAGTHLGVPPGRVDVVWPVAEPLFAPMSAGAADTVLDGLRRRVALPGAYALAVSHPHFTKNLECLLRAWSLIPPAVRAGLPLVVSCHLADHGAARVAMLAERLGITDDLVVTGLVTDAELVALYNRALLVVHPSRYEGFGLPVLEAMQCGTPVVTTTSSSLPEVAGDAAVLVDPDDAPGLAEAVVSLLGDPDRRAGMRERGLRQARRFNPRQLGEGTLAAYRRALAPDGTRPPAGGREAFPVRSPTTTTSGPRSGDP